MKGWTSGPDRLLSGLAGLADPTRLRLLAVLERHELGVAELTEVLRLPQSTVSRHLKVLAGSGFVAGRHEGTSRIYRLAALEPGARRLWRAAREEAQGWAALDEDRARLERRLAARRDEADRFFAGAAGDWERLRAELHGHGWLADALLALVPRELVVADLGCGTGDLAARLAGRVGRVHAVDRSASMLRAARRRLAGLENVTVHEADLEALPIEDASCDAALLLFVLGWTASAPAALAEATRILRPGGTAVVVDLARHDDARLQQRLRQSRAGFEPDELRALLAGAGLTATVPQPLAPGGRGPALLLATAERAATSSRRASRAAPV